MTKIQSAPPSSEVGQASLVLINPPGPDMGRRWILAKDDLVLGRGSDCDIQVDHVSVSRRHARVYRDSEGRWLAEDLGSMNGSFINDEPVQCSPLRDVDHLKLGAAIFAFLSGADEASYEQES